MKNKVPIKKYDITQCALYKCRTKRRLEYLLCLDLGGLKMIDSIIGYHKFEIDKNDFRSYFELGKKPKKLVKGRSLKNDAHWYGVSTFTNKEIIEFNMKFPNPHKKMAAGYVHCEGGLQETKDEHVCWWLYKDVDLSSFRIMEDKNE